MCATNAMKLTSLLLGIFAGYCVSLCTPAALAYECRDIFWCEDEWPDEPCPSCASLCGFEVDSTPLQRDDKLGTAFEDIFKDGGLGTCFRIRGCSSGQSCEPYPSIKKTCSPVGDWMVFESRNIIAGDEGHCG